MVRTGALERLATYGTLAPGRPNHHQLDRLEGRWLKGHVDGMLVDAGWGANLGYPALVLGAGSAIDVDIFESVDLPAHWARLDTFEGPGYERVVTTVHMPTDHVYGKPFFDYLAEQPAFAKIFNDVMTRESSDEGASIAAAHDFSGYRRIVDVGGGHGALLAAVLNRYPGPVGVLFDLPDVVATAHGAIDRHIAAGRVEKLAGDFSEAVPPGGDAYLLKWIVHDWDDEAAIRILTKCRTVMPPAGKVLLVEVVIPQGTAGSDATRLDTTMLVFTGSRERTEREYRELLHRAGLTLLAITPTASPFSILEATPAQDGQR
jgi:gamma-glutamylcyclotransferase (GGCT)/AIG2-like uncharacterized protein YtfP